MKIWIKNNWPKLIILAGLFFLFLAPPGDTDLGWHLRYGQQIFTTGKIWRANQIGYFLSDYQWAHNYSLYQLTTYFVYRFFNLWGLAIIGSLVLTTAFFFLIWRQKNIFWTIISSFFIILASLPVIKLGYRSQLFSFLGVSFIYWLIKQTKKFTWPKLIALIPLFALWANFHGAFIFGIALFVFATVEKAIKGKAGQAIRLALAAGLSALGALINPFGARIYSEIYRHSWYPLDKLIAEWVPPSNQGIFFILLVATLAAIGAIAQKKRLAKSKPIFLTLGWLFFVYLALRARRHLPFFALASVYLVEAIFPLPKLPPKISKGLVVVIFIFSLYHLNGLPKLTQSWGSINQLRSTSFPNKAVEYLKTKPNICQNIFNAYEWGGYLAWHLPNRKTFVDGRMPAWPTPNNKSPYIIYLEIIQARPGFNQALAQYQTDCLLISKGTFLDLELKKNPGYPWKQIYQDNHAVIYQQK